MVLNKTMPYLITEIGPVKGFHPVSSTTISLPKPYDQYNQCSLHIYHTLPPLLFVDTHELSQRNASYTFSHWGSRDLEKPVHALPDEISELLLNVRLSEVDDSVPEEGESVMHVEVPMHLRYGAPKTPSGSDPELYEQIHVDWPQGFLSCPPSSLVKEKGSVVLPPRVLSSLPIHNFLIPIPPHSNFSSKAYADLFLPLGNTKDLAFVEPLTALTILACCFWVFRMAFKTLTRLNSQAPRPKTS